MTPECPHGFEIGVYRGYTGAMSAPYSTCQCCKTDFYYIDSGSWTQNRQETVSHDKSLCPECGGKATRTVIENGKLILSETL